MAPVLPARHPHRARRTVTTMAAGVLLSLVTAGCGLDGLDGLVGQSEAAPEPAPASPTKMTAKNVRSFYGLVNHAYGEQDAARMCQLHDPAFIDRLLEQAARRGVAITTCEQLFQTVFVAEPDGYADRLSNVRVKGRTATLMSGDDQWRIGMVDGRMVVVDQKTGRARR